MFYLWDVWCIKKNLSFLGNQQCKNLFSSFFYPSLFAYLHTIAVLYNSISDFQKYNLLLLNIYMHVLYYFIYIFINQINSRYTHIKGREQNQIKWALTGKSNVRNVCKKPGIYLPSVQCNACYLTGWLDRKKWTAVIYWVLRTSGCTLCTHPQV